MDEPKTVTTGEVVNLIREALESIAAIARDESTRGLLFPNGIGDVQVKVTAPGGAAIELHVASPAVMGGGYLPFWGQSSAHLMDIDVKTGGALFAKFSVSGNNWSAPYQLVPGPNPISVTTPD